MSFETIFYAIFPVIIVIGLGIASRITGLVSDTDLAGIERLTYVILFPALLISNIAAAPISGEGVWWLAAAMLVTQLAIAGLSWAFFARSETAGPTGTSAFQGAVRFNTYIALALVFALFGAPGVQLAAIPLGMVIITVNIFCVAFLVKYGRRDAQSPNPNYWRQIASNPLVLACIIGIVLNPIIDDWPRTLDTVFNWFSAAAVALGLFAVGAGLRPVAMPGSWTLILQSNAISLVLKPALFLAIGFMIGLSAEVLTVGLICMAAPTATSSYILARQMGGDAAIMAQILSIGTMASGATLFLWLFLASALTAS